MIIIDNNLVISGRILKSYPVRKTPSGVEVSRFVLEHVSRQIESGSECEVRCKIFCVWVNPQDLKQIESGNSVTVSGFLNNNSKSELVLHITKFLDKGN